MCSRDGESETRGRSDHDSRDDRPSRCLSEVQFLTSDLLADRDDDTFPSDHRAESERDRDHDDHPPWSIVSGLREIPDIISDISDIFLSFTRIRTRDHRELFRREGFIIFLYLEYISSDILSIYFLWIIESDERLEFGDIFPEFCSDRGIFCLECKDIDGIYLVSNLCYILLEILHIEIWVDREGCREKSHEDEENEAYSLLSIISSVFIAHPCT